MGAIAQKYAARAAAAQREAQALRTAGAQVLKTSLQDTTDEQLYDRTNLSVSGAMRRSIQVRPTASGAEVFYAAAVAPHAARRVQETGRSKAGGHDKTMNPPRACASALCLGFNNWRALLSGAS